MFCVFKRGLHNRNIFKLQWRHYANLTLGVSVWKTWLLSLNLKLLI